MNPSAAAKARFDHQVEHFLSIAWAVTPRTVGDETWEADYEKNAETLAAVRSTRNFAANNFATDAANAAGGWHRDLGAHFGEAAGTAFLNEKDSLTGTLEAVADGKNWEGRAPERDGIKNRLDDHLLFSAPTLIKRFWDLAYLNPDWGLSFDEVANTAGIADHEPFNNNKRDPDSDAPKYFAVLKFDGDSVGKWISGKMVDHWFRKDTGERVAGAGSEFHSAFSAALSEFALEKVPGIVQAKGTDGFLIYAGGDDVLALLPADSALCCAAKLRDAYCATLKKFVAADGSTPDGSCGVAIAHFKAPLQDVVHAAGDAEKRKSSLGRSAIAVTLIKRSGGITIWDNKWEHGSITLCDALAAAMSADVASAKLPHRIIALLEPYLDAPTPLIKAAGITAAGAGTFLVDEIAEKEIAHALSRQVTNHKTRDDLEKKFEDYLNEIAGTGAAGSTTVGAAPSTDTVLSKLIGLCTTAAFAKRTKSSEPLKSATATTATGNTATGNTATTANPIRNS
ncbi:MAG: type III-B CRISPR-associated protein Cas10/Cmr2 [Puniceicoccales bacterium]|nr:type III-B CRISPR-associated protein Cas10/Cmr2 [Puniceicoccales bacterium]